MTQPTGKAISFNDMVDDVRNEVSAAHRSANWTLITTSIDAIVNELNGLGVTGKLFQDFTVDELSRIGGRLSALHFSLSDLRAEAYRLMKIAKAAVGVKQASVHYNVKESLAKTLSKRVTVSDVSIEVERQMARTKLISDLHEAEYEKLQSYWYSIPHILDSIDIRIRYLDSNKMQKGYSTKFNDGDGLEIPDLNSEKQAVDYAQALADAQNA